MSGARAANGSEVPKVERGEQPLDLDSRTDNDVDAPAPGDR